MPFFVILASTYGPGPYGLRSLGPYGPGPFIIWKNFLSQICPRTIWSRPKCQKACKIGQIQKCLHPKTTERLIYVHVTSKLNYRNSLLYGLPQYQCNKLQRVQIMLSDWQLGNGTMLSPSFTSSIGYPLLRTYTIMTKLAGTLDEIYYNYRSLEIEYRAWRSSKESRGFTFTILCPYLSMLRNWARLLTGLLTTRLGSTLHEVGMGVLFSWL